MRHIAIVAVLGRINGISSVTMMAKRRMKLMFVHSTLFILFLSFICPTHAAEAPVLQDPMRPADWVAESYAGASETTADDVSQPENWQLSMLVSGKRNFAVINGQVLHIGEQLNDAQLQEISADSVTLRWQEQDIVLSLLPVVVKTEVSRER